ncbi:MAG: metallophosphoesterase [Lewinellaceae bacterium]|nr:metallophosphoesterase [Lewinellaceae bacterium]
MLLKKIWYCALVCAPLSLLAGDPPVDGSNADTDGPHVFYRGQSIIVKSVERYDTTAVARSQVFSKKTRPTLTCNIPDMNDKFSFQIREKLSVEPDHYDLPERMLALSDIEGDFKAFKMMLLGAGVIDEQFKWSFGDGHLVLVGDFFDRGINVTECLWLIYKLEPEAEAAGGKVHFILGNHEIMNLQGYTDYVRKKYFANAVLIGEEYKYWYDDHSELGRWLRTKNCIEKIGDYVFCHGGVSPEMAATGMSISEINRIGRKYIDKPFSQLKTAESIAVFDDTGVFWYRGAAKNLISSEEMDQVLKYLGASRIVVGHTLQPDVRALYDGRLICIDLYHEETVRRGFVKTLWVESGRPYGLDSNGAKSSVITIAASTSPAAPAGDRVGKH